MTPLRMCIVCRTRQPLGDLLRFVRAKDGSVVFDGDGQMDSRGAYTCPKTSCLEKAVQRRAFLRAFRNQAVLVDAKMIEEVSNALMPRILENIESDLKR